jgi:hypothetical protein
MWCVDDTLPGLTNKYSKVMPSRCLCFSCFTSFDPSGDKTRPFTCTSRRRFDAMTLGRINPYYISELLGFSSWFFSFCRFWFFAFSVSRVFSFCRFWFFAFSRFSIFEFLVFRVFQFLVFRVFEFLVFQFSRFQFLACI